jgi:bidirectional [NiFe] hydrogenase diaphorase subunit
VLHTAQELFGYLQPDVLYYIAHGLKLPPSRVYGVATFYHSSPSPPRASTRGVVCTGTACYVKGADLLLAAVEERLGTVAGKTTADGQVSLMTARCLGACGLAPVAVYDGEVAGGQTPERRRNGWRMGRPWISLICGRSSRRNARPGRPSGSAAAHRPAASRPAR